MRFRSPLVAILLVVVTAGLWFWTRPADGPARPAASPAPGPTPARPGPAPVPASTGSASTAPGGPATAAPPSTAAGPGYDAAAFPIAARLHAPEGTAAADLAVVLELLETWRTNFPREGNPVGENADITAALLGANRLELALVPRAHPALNARGELCDRWGSAFRFHQLSGERMEVISAGPDRRFGTADDLTLTPP